MIMKYILLLSVLIKKARTDLNCSRGGGQELVQNFALIEGLREELK